MGRFDETARHGGGFMNVEAFWKDILEQNRDTLAGYFCPGAAIRWHCTNEQFTVSEFVRANCDYPGEWDGKIERVEEYGPHIVTVVNVFPKDRFASFHVVSFMALKEDRILTLDEYWADDGEAPAWRKSMGIGTPIR